MKSNLSAIQNPILELTESLTNLTVYPNPATTYITFDYKMPQYIEDATLVITDITGKEVQTTTFQQFEGQYLWDTRRMKNGLYVYTLKDGKGQTITSGKVSIIK